MPQIIPIRDLKLYEDQLFKNNVITKLSDAEDQIKSGQTLDAAESIKRIREKYTAHKIT